MKPFFISLMAVFAMSAQTPSVLVTGLSNPGKMTLTPAGNLLVVENGTSPNSGRISLVDRSGKARPLFEGLPSGLAAPNNDPDGASAVAIAERTLFITTGEGDVSKNGPRQGTNIANPDGISSPLFSAVLRVRLNTEVDRVAGSFVMKPSDQALLADGEEITLKTTAGDEAKVEVLVNLPDYSPDPNIIYRNSHPYGIALHPDYPESLFINDAGQNTILRVDRTTGRTRTLTRFAPVKSVVPGPPFSDAVPDSIRVYGGQFLVTLLTGFPFTPGQSRVMTVDPVTGATGPFITGLSSAIDVATRRNSNGTLSFYVLEFSSNLGSTPPGAGRLTRYDTPQGVVVLSNLVTPTSMVIDQATGDLFIAESATGVIKQLKLQ